MKNIVLIGFMGTGKTCVGKLLAQALDRSFVDLDDAVEQAIGMTIAEYFSRFGEAAFRDREHEAVAAVSGQSGLVVATGGGVVLRQDNIDRLKETGVLVWLAATEQEIVARTSGCEARPLLNRPDRLQAIRELFTARLPQYRQANVWVETGGRSVGENAVEVLKILRKEGWIDGVHSGESGAP